MSLYDYIQSRKIDELDPSFLALLFSLMRKADDINTAILQRNWPNEYTEMRRRYHAPGGVLPHDEKV